MFKRTLKLILISLAVINLCGCAGLVMSVLSENAKVKRTVNASYSDTLEFVKATLKTENIKFTGANIKPDIAEVTGIYADNRDIRIFVTRVSENESIVAIRAGMGSAGREAAEKILDAVVEIAKSRQTK